MDPIFSLAVVLFSGFGAGAVIAASVRYFVRKEG